MAIPRHFDVYPPALKDAEACARVSRSKREARDFSEAFRTERGHWLVARDGEQIVGVAGVLLWSWNQVAWLTELSAADPGCLPQLLDSVSALARDRGALMLMDFLPQGSNSLEQYLQNGFRICGFNDSMLPGRTDASVVYVARDLR